MKSTRVGAKISKKITKKLDQVDLIIIYAVRSPSSTFEKEVENFDNN